MSKVYDPNYVYKPTRLIVGQKVVICNDAGEVLFLRRSDKSSRAGGWDFPGGGLDEGEDPYKSIRRELQEEAGLNCDELKLIHALTEKQGGDFFLHLGYSGRIREGKVKLSWEHDEFKWLGKDEALKVDLPKLHKEFLERHYETIGLT